MRFADILASQIHDMKNSLGMVINLLESLELELGASAQATANIVALQQEARRLNNNLIELLTLYKIENEKIAPNVEEQSISDLLEELVLENQASARAKGVELGFHCDSDLVGYFDEGLIRGVIGSLIGNGLRYTHGQLLLTAGSEDGYLVLRVEDDGAGYPPDMLEAQAVFNSTESVASERTQLGIHFAGLVAAMHCNRDRTGFVRLSNQHQLKGGCFSIWLP